MNHERLVKPLLVAAAVLVVLVAAGVPVGAVAAAHAPDLAWRTYVPEHGESVEVH